MTTDSRRPATLAGEPAPHELSAVTLRALDAIRLALVGPSVTVRSGYRANRRRFEVRLLDGDRVAGQWVPRPNTREGADALHLALTRWLFDQPEFRGLATTSRDADAPLSLADLGLGGDGDGGQTL